MNNPVLYHDFLRSSEPWRRLYCWIKSEEFVRMVLQTLSVRRIELGLSGHHVSTTHAFSPDAERRLAEQLRELRAQIGHSGVLRTRFEFSMLPADGGCIKPHTDSPTKLITLVVSMVRPGEWDPAWGGATAIERPKDAAANFNYINLQMNFEEMETLDVYPFQPNQCVLFVKTFNSHHSVHPMTGRGSSAFRRTLTINIEKVVG